MQISKIEAKLNFENWDLRKDKIEIFWQIGFIKTYNKEKW